MQRSILNTLNPAVVVMALCATLITPQVLAGSAPPKYKADVPQHVLTPDTVETERLGNLRFFDGMPDDTGRWSDQTKCLI